MLGRFWGVWGPFKTFRRALQTIFGAPFKAEKKSNPKVILGRQRMRKEKGREEKTTSKKSSEEQGPARAKRRAEKAAKNKEGRRREENPDPKPRGIGTFFGSVSIRFGSTVPVSLLGSQVPVVTVPVPRFAVRFLSFLHQQNHNKQRDTENPNNKINNNSNNKHNHSNKNNTCNNNRNEYTR